MGQQYTLKLCQQHPHMRTCTLAAFLVTMILAVASATAQSICHPTALAPFYETCRQTNLCQGQAIADAECQACVKFQAQSAYYSMLVNAIYVCRRQINPLGLTAPASPGVLQVYHACINAATSNHRKALKDLGRACKMKLTMQSSRNGMPAAAMLAAPKTSKTQKVLRGIDNANTIKSYGQKLKYLFGR